jgi:hypothetical protein
MKTQMYIFFKNKKHDRKGNTWWRFEALLVDVAAVS